MPLVATSTNHEPCGHDGLPATAHHPTGAQEHDPADDQEHFGRRWVVPLAVIAIIAALGALFTWQNGFIGHDQPPDADGGLLLFTNQPLGNTVSATVTAAITATGYPNTSALTISLAFEHAPPGLRWMIAASGQYRPEANTELNAYCELPNQAQMSDGDILCRNGPDQGSQNIRYDPSDHLEVLEDHDMYRVTDSLDGYLDHNTTFITGSLSATTTPNVAMPATMVVIPIPSPTATRLGSDDYYALPPIGIIRQGDSGMANTVSGTIPGTDPTGALFADLHSQTPLNYLSISALTLTVDVGSATTELTFSSPPTSQSDSLDWHEASGIDAIHFTLHDPFAADKLARHSFIAGILISISASALLLLVEKFIEHRLKS